MSEVIRLYLLTDDPAEAAVTIFGMRHEKLPRWVKVVCDWQEIARLPAGAPCLCLWFQPRGRESLAETAWRERRREVELDDDFGKWQGRVIDWSDKYFAARRAEDLAALAGGNVSPLRAAEAVPAPAASERKQKWS